MTEVISQIWFGILLAGIIGGITGWFLRGNGKKRLHELEKSWQKRYQQLMQEKTSCQEKVEQLHVIRHERNALSNKLKQMHDTTKRHAGLEARLSNLHHALEKKNHEHIEEQNNVGLLQKKIRKMQSLMHEKDSMVHVITQKLASSGVLNKEKQEYVERLEQETSDLQQRLANSEKKMMANDAQIQQLMLNTEQNTADDNEVQQPQFDVEEYQKSQNEIAELRTHLDNANMRIQGDQEKITRLVSELPVLAKQLHESQGEIQRRDDEVDALQDILGTKVQEYEKMDRDLDEYRISLLDADSKIEVLYEALDQEREKNQQINADNKLKDYRLSEYAEDAENKALEIQALYGRLTSTEFDLMGAQNEGVNSVSANNLLSAHSDEVEHERQKLLKQCDLVESELSHYKLQLESADQQLEVQKVVNRKLREELGRILGKEPESIKNEFIADIAVDASVDESEFIESTENAEEDDANIEDIAKSIYEAPKTEFDADESVAIPVEDEGNIETIEKEMSDVEDEPANGKPGRLTAALLSGAAVAAGVSQIDDDVISDIQDDNGFSNDVVDSEQTTKETNMPDLEPSEDMGREKLAILGWYGSDTPKINLLSYGSSYSNADDVQGRLSLEKLQGMSGAKLSKLKAYGITSISDLHEFAKIPKGKRSALESKINDDEWKAWCSHADLMRIDGMNITECKMLNELGVFSVEELSNVGVSELKGKIHQLKRKQKIAAAIGPNTVSNWVNTSKELMQASNQSVGYSGFTYQQISKPESLS